MSQNSWMNLFEKPSAPGALLVFTCLIDWSSSSIVRFWSYVSFSVLFSFKFCTISFSVTSPRKLVKQSGPNIFRPVFYTDPQRFFEYNHPSPQNFRTFHHSHLLYPLKLLIWHCFWLVLENTELFFRCLRTGTCRNFSALPSGSFREIPLALVLLW